MDSSNAAVQRKSGSKKKNVKCGGFDKDNLKSSLLQTCNNKSRKKLNNVAFMSGLSRFVISKNTTLGPGIYNISFPKCRTQKNGKIRGRLHDFKTNFNLAPNMYADGLKHHTIQTRVEKKITARGPFDTFTGPRDSSTLIGHSTEKKCHLISDNWPLPLESYSSKNRDQRTYTNVFKHNLPREKLENHVPAFNCVDIFNWLSIKTNKYPFNCSQRVGDSLQMIENSLKPGPGHYNIDVCKQRAVNGHTNVFKSTTVRQLQLARRGYSIFDD